MFWIVLIGGILLSIIFGSWIILGLTIAALMGIAALG
jgi:hypothetical protein